MAKKQPTELPASSEQEARGLLIDALQSMTQQVETLNQQVGTLADTAQVLTAAIEDVRMEIEHATRNIGRPPWAPTQALSMPHDALAEDFGGQINQVKPEELPPEETIPSIAREENPQRELWD